MAKLASAAAAAATFFSSAGPAGNGFLKLFRVKQVMAEPVQTVEKEMVDKAAETVTAFRRFVVTGKPEQLALFYKNYEEYFRKRKDKAFVQEFVKKFRELRTDPVMHNIVGAYQRYEQSLVKPGEEYSGFAITNLAKALEAVFGDFRKRNLNAEKARGAIPSPNENARKAVEDFVSACRESEFGKRMSEEQRLWVMKAKPAKPLRGVEMEIAMSLSSLQQDMIAVDKGLIAFADRVRGKPDLEALAKVYRKQFDQVHKKFEEAYQVGKASDARELLDEVKNKLQLLKDKIINAALIIAQAEALAMNFDYGLRTGRPSFPFAAGLAGAGGAALFPLSGGIEGNTTFYGNLKDEHEKEAFLNSLEKALKKIKVTVIEEGEVVPGTLYDLVERYGKKNDRNFINSIIDLNKEAMKLYVSFIEAMDTKTPDAVGRLADVARTHRANIGSDYMLENIVDVGTLSDSFGVPPSQVWNEFAKRIRASGPDSTDIDSRLFSALMLVGRSLSADDAAKANITLPLLNQITDPTKRKEETTKFLSSYLQGNPVLAEQISNLNVVSKYFVSEALERLNQRGMLSGKSATGLITVIADIASKDAYLIPSFVNNVVFTLADVVRSPDDFTILIGQWGSFIATRAGNQEIPLTSTRNAMLALFRLTKQKMPEISPAVDHYFLDEEISFPGRNPEMPMKYQVKPTILSRFGEFYLPQYMPQVMPLSLRPPFYVPPDTGGVNFGILARSSAITNHLKLQNTIYRASKSRGLMRVPLAYKIKEVSTSRMIREQSKIFAQYDEGKVYGWGPILEQAGYGGFYYSKPLSFFNSKEKSYNNLEGAVRYMARTPEGSIFAATDAKSFGGQADLYHAANMTNIGRIRSLNQFLHYAEAGNVVDATMGGLFNLVQKQVTEEEKKKAQEEKREPVAKPGMDMIFFTTGYREKPEGGEEKGRVLGRLFLVDTAGNKYELRGSYDQYVWFKNYLYGAVERENLHAEAKAGGLAARFETPATQPVEAEAPTTAKPSGKWIFRRESGRMEGFEGAMLGFTIDKKTAEALKQRYLRDVAQAGIVGTMPTLSGKEAYINWADALSKTVSQKHAFIAIYRGSDAEALATGITPTAPTYPAYKEHIGEFVYKLLRPKKTPEAPAVEARAIVGYETKGHVTKGGLPQEGYGLQQAGGRVLVEWSPRPGVLRGFGVTGGYVERNLQQEYRQLEATADGMYTQMKAYLGQIYGWSEEKSGKYGALGALQLMYSTLLRPTADKAGMEELKNNPYYGAGLLMLWGSKWKLVAGGSRTPGYAFNQINGVMTRAFESMSAYQDRSMQQAYLSSINQQLADLFTKSYYTGSIGITVEGKLRMFDITGSTRVREDLTDVYGDLESMLFFNKKEQSGYLQLLMNLYNYQSLYTTTPTTYTPSTTNTAYLSLLGGFMLRTGIPLSYGAPRTSWFDMESESMANGLTPAEMRIWVEGKRNITFTSSGKPRSLEIEMDNLEHTRGIKGNELLSYFSKDKKRALSLLFGREPNEKEEAMELVLTKSASSLENPAKEFFFRMVEPLEEGKLPFIEIGTGEDLEEWQKLGRSLGKNVFALGIGTAVEGKAFTDLFGYRLPLSARNKTEVALSRRLQDSPSSRSRMFYALVASKDTGEGYMVMLGDEKDFKKWKADGHELGKDIRRINLEQAEKGRMKAKVEGLERTELFPAFKLVGGPILKLETTEGETKTKYAGYEIQGLLNVFRSKWQDVILASHYAKLSDSARGLDASRIEFELSWMVTTKRTELTTNQLAFYILPYQDRVKIVIGTPAEATSMENTWKKTGGTIGFEWKKIEFGRDFSWDIVVDGGKMTVPTSWMPASVLSSIEQPSTVARYDLTLKGVPNLYRDMPYIRAGISRTWTLESGKRVRLAAMGGYGPASLWLEPVVPLSTVQDLNNLANYAQMFSGLRAAYFMAYLTVFFGTATPAMTLPSAVPYQNR